LNQKKNSAKRRFQKIYIYLRKAPSYISARCQASLVFTIMYTKLNFLYLNELKKVDELIDPITEHWDISLLQQIFTEEDVQMNGSIPVHQEMDDVVGWHFDAKGQFSVKSAYKVQRNCEFR